MAKKVISMTLSEKSIQNAIKQLRDYQNSLEYKCSLLAQKLADRGIEVARNNTGNFGHYITFEKKVIPEKNGCTAIIVAKDIAKKFHLDRRKTASILDTFSCLIQGIIPYGAQMLIAAGLANISPISIIGNLYYPFTMGACALLAILFRYPKRYS